MSNHLDTIIQKHNQICNLQVVFVDIEKYSQRRTGNQVTIINAFTDCIKKSLDEVAKHNISFIQANNINFENDIILIPTGDGCAINFSFDGLHNVHLKFAEILMQKIYEMNNSTPVCEKFSSNGWCNCHNKFNVRIGVTEGKGLIYKDVNRNYNVAGNVINMAARLLSLSERNQILLNEDAYKQIIDLEEDPNFSDKFLKITRVKIKHDIFIDAYIYNPELPYINGMMPNKFVARDKMKDLGQKMSDAGIPFPFSLFTEEKEEDSLNIEKFESVFTSLFDVMKTTRENSTPITLSANPSSDIKSTPKKTRRSSKK
jgi:hypothetical protein